MIELGNDCRLYLGDALDILRTLPNGIADGVITDSPYSSGGQFRGDRAQSTVYKYVSTEQKGNLPDFTGDNRDQRSFLLWATLWLSLALQKTKPGGIICTFTDWRQLPTTTDAIQAGGWVWRGIVPWNKTEAARPQKGRFRQQCEYIVWGTRGPMDEKTAQCLPGFFTYTTVSGNGKNHIAEKPESLMVDILEVTGRKSTILDPFMGSGTTGAACMKTGRNFIGIEMDRVYYEIAKARIEEAKKQPPLFRTRKEKSAAQPALQETINS